MLWKYLAGFLLVFAVLALIGWRQLKKKKAEKGPDADIKHVENALDNVVALGDRFNRARYMGQDGNGKQAEN